MNKKLLLLLLTTVVLSLMTSFEARIMRPVHQQESDSQFIRDYGTPAMDNPDYYYAAIKSAPDGVYYRQAGFNPDRTRIVAQKSFNDGTARTEIVLMDPDGSDEIIISAGDSGTGDIYGYMNPFWSDDGTVVGFAQVPNAGPNKIVKYELASGIRSYIYQPTAPLDACNPDFVGNSTSTIVFWDWITADGAADLFIWDGSTLTNITNSSLYSDYEPVSNNDGSIILYWSGETTTEPVNTTHTLTYTGGSWVKDVGFTPIADSYWSFWSGKSNNNIGVVVMSTKDVHVYDNTGSFLFDVTGPGYSGGTGQWNFIGFCYEGNNGEILITSNAGRTTAGRDIIIANPRAMLFADAVSGSNSNPGTADAPFVTISKAVTEAVSGGTVNVAAGTYTEDVLISKPLTLKGANADVDFGARVRGPESLIQPLASGGPAISLGTGVGPDNVTINGFEITGTSSNNAIYCGGTGPNYLTIKYNYIHHIGTARGSGNVYAINYRCAALNQTDINISHNYFDYILNATSAALGSSAAIWMGQSTATGTFSNVLIEYNTIKHVESYNGTLFGTDGINASGINIGCGWKSTGYLDSPIIRYNTISDLTGGAVYGIALQGNTPGAQILNNTISNLTPLSITQNAAGLCVFKNVGYATNNGTGILAHNNSLTNMYYGIYNATTNVVDGTSNWWGHASGPLDDDSVNPDPEADNPDGLGVSTTGYVTYDPWWANAGMTVPGSNSYVANGQYSFTVHAPNSEDGAQAKIWGFYTNTSNAWVSATYGTGTFTGGYATVTYTVPANFSRDLYWEVLAYQTNDQTRSILWNTAGPWGQFDTYVLDGQTIDIETYRFDDFTYSTTSASFKMVGAGDVIPSGVDYATVEVMSPWTGNINDYNNSVYNSPLYRKIGLYPSYAIDRGYTVEVIASNPSSPQFQQIKLSKPSIGYEVILFGFYLTTPSDPLGYMWWTTFPVDPVSEMTMTYNSGTGFCSGTFETPLSYGVQYFIQPYAEINITSTDLVYAYEPGSMDMLLNGVTLGPVHNVTRSTFYQTIQGAINDPVTEDGDLIEVAEGDYLEIGQIVVSKTLTITGDGETTVVKPDVNYTSSDGWIKVTAGKTLNMSGIKLDGTGKLIDTAMNFQGDGVVDGCWFTQIKNGIYGGDAIWIENGCDVDVLNSDFTEIGRDGILHCGTGLVQGNTYVGKGDGNWLDYFILAEYGCEININNNVVSNCTGIALSDGSGSAAIAVWDDPYTNAEITNNQLNANSVGIGIIAGWGSAPYTDPVVDIGDGNMINGGEWGITLYNYYDYAFSPSLTFGSTTLKGQSVAAIDFSEFCGSGMIFDGSELIFDDGLARSSVAVSRSVDSENRDRKALSKAGQQDRGIKANREPRAFALPANINRAHSARNGSRAVITNNFDIEDLVVHAIDAGGRGLVVWNPDNVYVTPDSYVDPETAPSVQRAIDAVTDGYTINVEAGTYTEPLLVGKSVTLLGPNAAIDPNTGTRDPEAILQGTTTSGLSDKLEPDDVDVVVKGFTFDNLRIDNFWNQTGSNSSLITGNAVENNIFTNVLGTAVYLRDGRNSPLLYSNNVSVSNNKIVAPADAGIVPAVDYTAGTGILLFGAANSGINNNVITDPAYNGIQLGRDSTLTVTGNVATGCVQPALQSAQWNDGTNTISGNTFSTTSTTKAAVRLYGFTNSYYPLFNFSGNTFKDSRYAIQIGHGDAGKGYNDIRDADYSFSGNTFTNIADHRLIVYLATEASTAETTEMDTYFAQIHGTGARSHLITSADPYTYVLAPATVHNETQDIWYYTIQAAIDAANAAGGDVIHAFGGTYEENYGTGTWANLYINKSLTLYGDGPDQTIVALNQDNGKTEGVYISGTDLSVTIRGLGLTRRSGATYACSYGIKTSGSFDSLVLDSLEIAYAQDQNINLGSSYDVLTLSDCNIHHAQTYGLCSFPTLGVLTIENTHFDYNALATGSNACGMLLRPVSMTSGSISGSYFDHNGKHGVSIGNVNDLEFDSCSASYNTDKGILYYEDGTSENVAFNNCTIYDNGGDGFEIQPIGTSPSLTNISITGGSISENGRYGIFAAYSTTNPPSYDFNQITVEGVTLTDNANPAIWFAPPTNTTHRMSDFLIQNNIIVTGDGPVAGNGIHISRVDDIELCGNIVSGRTSGNGIAILYATGIDITGNGITNNAYAGITLVNCVTAAIDSNTITGNIGNTGNPGGLTIRENCQDISADQNTITGNNVGVWVHSTGINGTVGVFLSDNNISGNTNYGVQNMTTTSMWVNASDPNWWGSSTGPTHSSNPGGTGDVITDFVRYDPWWANPEMTVLKSNLPVINITHYKAYPTIQLAINDPTTLDGDTIYVSPGNYPEVGQIVINKNLTIYGDDKLTTTVTPTANTGSSGDARGWWLVQSGKTLNLSNLTLDGSGYDIMQGIRSFGTGTIDNNIIRNISYPGYNGIGVVMMGGNMTVSNNELSNIGRINIMAFGTSVTAGVISGNTITGKGVGDWLDYGVEIGGGAVVSITGNEFTNCYGVASSDGSQSAAILVTSYYGPNSGASITGNNIHDNSFGICAGYDGTDTSDLSISGNTFNDNPCHVYASADGLLDFYAALSGNTYDRKVLVLNGSPEYPYAIMNSIQGGIDFAVTGDIVEPQEDTYDETLNIDARTDITVRAAAGDLVTIRPSTVLDWNALGYTTNRKTSIRIVNSTDITIDGITLDCELIKNQGYIGVLYANSTGGVIQNSILKNMYNDQSHYYDIMIYARAIDAPYTCSNRATLSVLNNQLIDTGRVGLVTHDYIHTIIDGNQFYKTTYSFGYGMEIGSASTAEITDNVIHGYTASAASDGSAVSGIYIENCYTTGYNCPKPVTISGNEIYNCQNGMVVGNQFNNYAGNVDIAVDITGNNFHDNLHTAIQLTDEDKANGSSVTATLTGNTISSTLSAFAYDYAILAYALGDGDLNLTMTDNQISGYPVGLMCYDWDTGTGNLFDLTATGNTFDESYYGMYLGNLNWESAPIITANSFLTNNPIQVYDQSAALDLDAIIAAQTYWESYFKYANVIYYEGTVYPIQLYTGWNLVSSPVTPFDIDMEAVMSELIDAGYLIKVQDEAGQAMDKDLEGNWMNNIGDWSDTEGYYVRVNTDCILNIYGIPVALPLDVPLLAGWNIISYPKMTPEAAMTILQPLIDAGQLIKVQNESGQAIEKDMFGNWIDNIGNFVAGEGYHVKVTAVANINYAARGREFASGKGLPVSRTRANSQPPKHFRSYGNLRLQLDKPAPLALDEAVSSDRDAAVRNRASWSSDINGAGKIKDRIARPQPHSGR